ncbi:MAG: hypothetical protein F4Y97_01130 [Dehalococcoidia bacterium]|nr:hypothetical protein [Dehalococcoidia bacterium]
MFATIGHTIDLMKMSWRVLMLDRELILFPIMSVVALVAVAAAVLGGGLLSGAFGLAQEGGEGSSGDLALGLLLAFVSMAVVIFFNAALVAAAMERLRGGDPSVTSGLKAASARVPQILAWAVVVTAVMLILRAIRNRGGIAGQIAAMFGEAAWELASFFAVPFIVEEGVGPFDALRRSASLLRQTWGQQITAGFGFLLIYLGVIIIAVLPALVLAAIHPLLGIAIGIPLIGLAWGTVSALEGIFKAALYDYATGREPHGFDQASLQNAYHPQASGGMRGVV